MLENNGFFAKTMFFLGKLCVLLKKAMFFDTTSQMIYLIIKHMHFIKIKIIHV